MSVKYISNLSGGKDSLCQTLKLMELGFPLDYAVFYDGGMEFKSIYKNIEKITPLLESYGCKVVTVRPENHFLFDMLVRPVNQGKENEHYGYDWCGGMCRWQTSLKIKAINSFLASIGEFVQYVGIAADEPQRVVLTNNKQYPLADWGMTESDCLQYCYENGWDWNEPSPRTQTGYIDLYQILKRVSCYCCGNKNLEELRNIWYYLPDYWSYLKGLQSKIDRPFRRDGKTIFDLEEQFKRSSIQLSLFVL